MIRRLLIANRGEIAVRIIRACRELCVSPLAVFSEADSGSLHVALADAAYAIGPAPAPESYLCTERILDAARRAGADAIHPGYGFLSENAAFAQACEKAGIRFVGPPSGVLELLGDKTEAKRLASSVGVPVAPGYLGENQADARLAKEAAAIGAPVLIKAAAGGGGRGMRVVRDLDAFPHLLDEARREARGARGDDRVLLEKYIERPRHVEIQILADAHGGLVHLFERDCSIQRRHQKVVEESPAPGLRTETRARMVEAALSVAHAAGYVNAGTVEFLLEAHPEGEDAFYFLEVNGRLQVEHPVTEAVTGIDLVHQQLRIASGEALGFGQDQVTLRGAAIEMRILAETPGSGVPSAGTLDQWIEPAGPGVRIDSGVARGSEVTPFYDPLLAKLIVSAADRPAAVSRLAEALRGFAALGVATNVPYLQAIAADDAFRHGGVPTSFLTERLAGWTQPSAPPEETLLGLAAAELTRVAARPGAAGPADSAHQPGPWSQAGAWRNVR